MGTPTHPRAITRTHALPNCDTYLLQNNLGAEEGLHAETGCDRPPKSCRGCGSEAFYR